MLPFSLNESVSWRNHGDANIDASQLMSESDDYLRNGGYPETVQSRSLTATYMSTLFDSILLKDIARRYRVRNTDELYNLASYLLTNFCNLFSARELTGELGLRSVATTKKFCVYLSEPYLFFYLPRFNNKLKLMKKAPTKVFVVDNGFVNAAAFNTSENLGRLLENQVFVEFMRRGYAVGQSIFYYRTRNDKEIDFVLRRGHRVEALVQICYDITSEKTRKREFDALVEAADEFKCDKLLLITNKDRDTVSWKGKTIEIRPVYDF